MGLTPGQEAALASQRSLAQASVSPEPQWNGPKQKACWGRSTASGAGPATHALDQEERP